MESSNMPISETPALLHVDDETSNLESFRFNFESGRTLLAASNAEEALGLIRTHDIGVVIADQRMPGTSGLELLARVQEISPDTVGILLTAYADVDVLVAAINGGTVYRHVEKPWDQRELATILDAAMEKHELQRDHRALQSHLKEMNRYLQQELDETHLADQILGTSTPVKELHTLIGRVSPGDATVLLRGESGTGKELVARAIHENSLRSNEAFVRVNCAALAPGVLESELFGHERGAFTGAIGRRPGRFELADGGTLFLDEIGDLPPEIQVRLLRVLQEREFERVGGTETIRVDVRILSATNRDLEALLLSGEFREDLYNRLNVFPIEVPPLRERADDIELLAKHFIGRHSRRAGQLPPTLSAGALERLLGYTWPGNVRELENVVERALILTDGDIVGRAEVAFLPSNEGATDRARGAGLDATLNQLERRELEDMLDRCGGSKSATARALGINRTTLYYRLKKHGLG